MQINNWESVEVKRYVRPDLVIIEKRKIYNDTIEYRRLSFLFDEMMYTDEECDEEGSLPERYARYTRYHACRKIGDEICIMNKNRGWIVHKEATEALAEIIAEKELLNG